MLINNVEYRNQINHMIEVSNLDWSELNGKSVLITGAAGMLGSCMVDILIHLNETLGYEISIYALGRTSSKLEARYKGYTEKAYFHILEKDISKPFELEDKIDYIVHAASNASPELMLNYPVDTLLANVIGVNNMLELAVKCKSKLLYVSSGEMYGQPDETTLAEGFYEEYCGYVDYKSPRSCYPSGKRAAEVLCQSFKHQYGVHVNIVRPCHCYGPTMTSSDNRAVSQFIRDVMNGKDIVLKSTGELVRSHCYVVDVAYAMFYVMLKGENGEAYNIADKNSEVNIKTFASIVCATKEKQVLFDLPTDFEKQSFSKVVRQVLSAKKLEGLGWHAMYDLKAGVASTVKILEEV